MDTEPGIVAVAKTLPHRWQAVEKLPARTFRAVYDGDAGA